MTGRVFNVHGGYISVAEGWRAGPSVDKKGLWDPAELTDVIPGLRGRGRSDHRHHRDPPRPLIDGRGLRRLGVGGGRVQPARTGPEPACPSHEPPQRSRNATSRPAVGGPDGDRLPPGGQREPVRPG